MQSDLIIGLRRHIEQVDSLAPSLEELRAGDVDQETDAVELVEVDYVLEADTWAQDRGDGHGVVVRGPLTFGGSPREHMFTIDGSGDAYMEVSYFCNEEPPPPPEDEPLTPGETGQIVAASVPEWVLEDEPCRGRRTGPCGGRLGCEAGLAFIPLAWRQKRRRRRIA